jgi:hypothetical protein
MASIVWFKKWSFSIKNAVYTEGSYFYFINVKKDVILSKNKKIASTFIKKIMATSYSKFTYDDLDALGIVVEQSSWLQTPVPIDPSDWLVLTLEKNMDLPLSSEKAKCELIIGPILTELVEHNDKRITYFSGYNFDVDKLQGLKGRCDFIISKRPRAPRIEAPIFSIVEAKNDNLDIGIPQCIAEMYAAWLFNKKRGEDVKTIYGAVTFGLAWQFLKLEEKLAHLDSTIYYIRDLPQILGALQGMVA